MSITQFAVIRLCWLPAVAATAAITAPVAVAVTTTATFTAATAATTFAAAAAAAAAVAATTTTTTTVAAATATAATFTTAAAAAVAAAAATTVAAAATTTATATAAAAAVLFGAGLIYAQTAATVIFAIQRGNSCRCRCIGHFYKAETPEAARFPICNHCDRFNGSMWHEQFTYFLFCCLVRQVPYIKLL